MTRWFHDVSPEMHQGLARVYLDDPRFAAHYDDLRPGLARYASDAILALYPASSSSANGS